MHDIQVIELDGRPAALAFAGVAAVGAHVPDAQLAHVKAKALFALQIQAGERSGPYTDAAAERSAREVAAGASSGAPASRPLSGLERRGARRRRRV